MQDKMTKLFMVVNDTKEVQEHNPLMKMTNRVDQEDSFIDMGWRRLRENDQLCREGALRPARLPESQAEENEQ